MIYGYVRVSGVDQAAEGKTSLADQEAVIRLAAQLLKCPSPIIFSDPGVSGSVPLAERPGGKDMLGILKSGDIIVASKLDRMFRSAIDALVTVEHLKGKGIGVILMDISSDPVTGNGVGGLFFKIMAAVADFERERIAERVSEGRKGKRRRGGHTGGDAPYGHRVEGNGSGAVLVRNQAEQERIDDMVVAVKEYHSFSRAAVELNATGRRARKGYWTARQLIRILKRERPEEIRGVA